jgi:hypothetical protein
MSDDFFDIVGTEAQLPTDRARRGYTDTAAYAEQFIHQVVRLRDRERRGQGFY